MGKDVQQQPPPPPPPPQLHQSKTKKKNRTTTRNNDVPPSSNSCQTKRPTWTWGMSTLNPMEQLGRTGVFLLIVVCFVCFLCCFFFFLYVNRINVVSDVEYSMKEGSWVREEKRDDGVLGLGVVEEEGERCDFYDGKWVWDETYPLYDAKECDFLDGGFRCLENGRPDRNYTNWRWQPNHCNLPRFNAPDMLNRLRNKRLVFVGDSIGRNQWESLLCMLSSAVVDKRSIYEVNGQPITKHNGFLVFKFIDYNCTVEYYRTPFLVVQGRPPRGVPKNVSTTLRLDVMDWMSHRWKDADVLVFNTGHWWNHEKTIRSGCYFQEGWNVKMEMSVESAYKRSIDTLMDWVRRELNLTRTHVIYRTYSPVHFRGGNWKNGGTCHLETDPDFDAPEPQPRPWVLKTIDDILAKQSSDSGTVSDIDFLNITQMTEQRKDGHSSRYYYGPGKLAPFHKQDCSHWCLPGVPDTWNELLYALMVSRNSTTTSSQYSSTPRAKRRRRDGVLRSRFRNNNLDVS